MLVMKVLLIEDDPAVRKGAEQALQLAELDVESFPSAEAAEDRIRLNFPGIVIADVRLPGVDGLRFQQAVRAKDPEIPVILITGHGDIAMAVGAMQRGAFDFLAKPFASEQLVRVARRALEHRGHTLEASALRRQLDSNQGIESFIIGRSPAIERVRELILQLAGTDADVLILGETGTGKELVARALHDYGGQRAGNFVALNCGGLPEALFESELFGHEAGAFTGAMKRRIGKLEFADGGTVFLDEIESMPLSLQVKLLRVLQDRRLERLGSNASVPFNCRIVAATKEDLGALSERKSFRSDLLYRLNVITIELPPLRARREDIPLLFEHFVRESAVRYQRPAPVLLPHELHRLMAHSWPGNVRELANSASRFVLGVAVSQEETGTQWHSDEKLCLPEQVSRFERSLIEQELRRNNGNVAAASEALGIPKKTLYHKLSRYNGLSSDLIPPGSRNRTQVGPV
jgi:two-component system C4-dicarboxylate transport response regulator DctD